MGLDDSSNRPTPLIERTNPKVPIVLGPDKVPT